MSRFVFGFVLGSALAVGGGVATAAIARDGGFAMPRLPAASRDVGPVTVVLDRHGGRVFAGIDDARLRTSGILVRQSLGLVDVPAFEGSDAQWNRFVGCVRDHYEGFAVTVVDEPPAGGDYMLAMVGGEPERFGFEESVGGIAPHKGSVIAKAVVFVFQPQGRTVEQMCDTAAHEIGHAIGLDHSRECTDLMSYETCGPKEFRDRAAPCGEWEDRACDDGTATQNSVQLLASLVGRREREEDTASEPGPAVAVSGAIEPRISATPDPVAGAPFVVQVEVEDPEAVAAVDLYWYGQRGVRLRCGESSASIDFSCERHGDTWRFVLEPGSGKRKYVVRVTGRDGKVRKTAAHTIALT